MGSLFGGGSGSRAAKNAAQAGERSAQQVRAQPFDIEEHRNHLFLAFIGGSVQHSVVGEPIQFNGFLGAAEFGLGDEVIQCYCTPENLSLFVCRIL